MKNLFGWLLVFAMVVFCLSVTECQAGGFVRGPGVRVNVGNGFRGTTFRGSGFNGFRTRGPQTNVFNGVGVPVRAQSFGHVNSFNRVNAFGTRTVIDGFGNVFEVDAFGRPLIRASGFRGFSAFSH